MDTCAACDIANICFLHIGYWTMCKKHVFKVNLSDIDMAVGGII